MKKKVFLLLLEQICMIGFFAIAAVLCLQGFALADRISNEIYIKDHAVIAAQNTAEVLKSTHGDWSAAADILSGKADDDSLTILFDSQGCPSSDSKNEAFRVCAKAAPSEDVLLGKSVIRALYKDEVILEFTVGWQEDVRYAK